MKRKRLVHGIWGSATFGALLLSISLALPAWGQTLEWVRQTSGSSIDVDDAGNSYVTGSLFGNMTFGTGEANETELTASGDSDVFLAKYAEDGSLLWARQAGGAGADSGASIAVDGEGNSYITGSFAGSATFGPGEPNETNLTSLGSFDNFIAEYDSDGRLVWARQAGGGGRGIAVDGSGNIFVTGAFSGTEVFGSGEPNETILDSDGAEGEMFVAKYDNDGHLLWARQTSSASLREFAIAYGIAVNGEGQAFVTGIFLGTVTFGPGEAGETVLTSFGEEDAFLARYADDGSLLWVRQAGGEGAEKYTDGYAVAVDGAGNSYITGYFSYEATFGAGEGNETTLIGLGDKDIFVAKYAGDGSLLWAKNAGGSQFDVAEGDVGHGIALDEIFNVYVTGGFAGTAIFGPGEPNQTELTSFEGDGDIFLAKYASGGSLLWVIQAGGPETDVGEDVAVNGDDIFLAGRFENAVTFDSGGVNETTLTGFGRFLAKYSVAGANTIQDLIDLVASFNLDKGIENSLTVKLRNAQKAIDSGNTGQAANLLNAFLNEAEAQSGKALTGEQADRLAALAEEILNGLQADGT